MVDRLNASKKDLSHAQVLFSFIRLHFGIFDIEIVAGGVVGGVGKVLLDKGFVGAVGDLLGFDAIKAATDDATYDWHGFA